MPIKPKSSRFGLLFVSLLLTFQAEAAATNSQTSLGAQNYSFLVQATIFNGCLITSQSSSSLLGTLAFGTYKALSDRTVSTSLSSNSQIVLNCTPNTTISMNINGGLQYDTNRNMIHSSGSKIVYTLYSDSAYSQPISVNQLVSLRFTQQSGAITLPIFAQARITKANPPGNYSDTLTVTLSW
ncbi:spore coat U domain-containing protein [Utexia brackfieldae]|uniref:Csu type fimbrial protein n=1 Tax=Utexia brackfieldae TaxID=3074108 RepID=UPI00370D8ACF